jgi:hypothetical protein
VRKTGDVFRCVCCDPSMEVVQELPSWMFDRAACAAVRVLTNPLVDFAALRVLRALLNDTTKDRTLTLPLGATMGSHDQNRRETHAQPATSLSSASARDPAIHLFMESDNARRQRPDWKMLPPRTRAPASVTPSARARRRPRFRERLAGHRRASCFVNPARSPCTDSAPAPCRQQCW